MFASKAKACPIGEPFRHYCPLGQVPGLTSMLERLVRGKHFSLFGPFVSYKEKVL